MNERIRELADKIWAEEYWDNPNTDKLLPAQLNRFAELIVRECANLLRAESDRLWALSAKEEDELFVSNYEMCAEKSFDNEVMILEHFGVE
jgi:hypothetical protein